MSTKRFDNYILDNTNQLKYIFFDIKVLNNYFKYDGDNISMSISDHDIYIKSIGHARHINSGNECICVLLCDLCEMSSKHENIWKQYELKYNANDVEIDSAFIDREFNCKF